MSQLRKIRYRLFSWKKFPELVPADVDIDVVIPVVEKDLRILPLCLQGVRRNVAHNIKNIYIVSPDNVAIRDFCNKNELVFVEESSVLRYKPRKLNLITDDGLDRSGWLYQQFLKLSGNVGTCQYYLCIDADHILIRPHVFLTDDKKTVFYMSYEEHLPYYEMNHRLFPSMELASLFYVSHKMLFDKQQVEVLKNMISKAGGGKPWQDVIMNNIDRSTLSGFSEFETYGNFMSNQVKRPWLQKLLRYSKLDDFETLCDKYGKTRWSLTFPEYREKQ